MSAPVLGGIEGGGTKFVCAVASAPDRVLETVTVPTSDAHTTLMRCAEFFTAAQERVGHIEALGFACFGPIELRKSAAGYGRMLPTPKQAWSGVDLLEPLRAALGVPIELGTDVEAAALAEWRLGAGRDVGSLAYVTVGTGIGGAVVPSDPATPRPTHPEMGHLLVRRDPRDLEFAGTCPFHGDCLEGLASGPAIRARWGRTLDSLDADHIGVDVVAGYLGQLAAAIALMAPVERIVFGGGVMTSPRLLPALRAAAFDCLNGYPSPLQDQEISRNLICAPALGDRAGITGALLLAAHALQTGIATKA
jgi:fructokinase